MEDIHRLRLEVKRMGALLDLLDSMTGKQSVTRPLRTVLGPVFTAAGDLRTTQVNIALLKKHAPGAFPIYELSLRGEERAARDSLRTIMRGFDREGFRAAASAIGGVIEGFERTRVAVHASAFIGTLSARISRLLRRARTPRDLHEVRKNVKTLRNTLRLVSRWGVRRTTGVEERIVQAADRVLGSWRDQVVFSNHLRRYAVASIADPAADAIGELAAGLRQASTSSIRTVVSGTRRRMILIRSAAAAA